MKRKLNLSNEQKAEMVRRHSAGEASLRELASEYGCSYSTVSLLCKKAHPSTPAQYNHALGCYHYMRRTKGKGNPPKKKEPTDKERIAQLEKALREQTIKADAYERMLRLAEQDLGVQLIKKDGAKQ